MRILWVSHLQRADAASMKTLTKKLVVIGVIVFFIAFTIAGLLGGHL